MLKTIVDGLLALSTYKEAVLIFLAGVTGLGLFVSRYLGDRTENTISRYLISLCLGSVVLSVVAYAFMIVGYFVPSLLRVGSVAILCFALFTLFYEVWRGKAGFSIRVNSILAFVLALLLIFRLSFLQNIILPPYSDSPVHYQIVSGFIHPEASGGFRLSLGNIADNYYHFGFHSLVAWLALVSGISIEAAISLSGQMILVILPFSTFILAYYLTTNTSAAFYAGLLSAVGWPMPAFAVNWGKYPALAAIAIAPAVVAAVVFHEKNNNNSRTYLWKILLLGGICLIHTRILICLILLVPSLFIAAKIDFEDGITAWQALRFSLLYTISLLPLYEIIVNFYPAFLVWLAFLVLLPFAFYVYPRLCIGIFIYTLGSWMVLKIPALFPRYVPVLLDKQFVAMFLYIPFSILGGTGFAGLLKVMKTPGMLIRRVVIVLPVALVLANAYSYYSFSPNPCCNYFDTDDQTAFAWISQNSLPNSLFLISAFEESGKNLGTDAGIWISPLTGRPVNKLPYTFNWNSQNAIETICLSGAKDIYIYAGNDANSFNVHPLTSNSYRKEFRSGQIIIYQLTGCSELDLK